MAGAEHYTYRVHWSPEDEAYIGTVAELPSLSWIAEGQAEAFVGILKLAAETVADLRANHETPPEALADREYSGKFVVRIPPEAHRLLVIQAAEQNGSINRLAASRLVLA